MPSFFVFLLGRRNCKDDLRIAQNKPRERVIVIIEERFNVSRREGDAAIRLLAFADYLFESCIHFVFWIVQFCTRRLLWN